MFTAKDLRKLILPLIVEQFLAVTIGMADTIMVASTGEAAMSSVSLVDAINILLINIFSALATGGAIVASQYLGREDNKRANVAAKQLLLVTTAMSAFIMAVCLIGRNPILDLIFGKIEPEVMDNCRVYFFWSALSYPFLAVYNAGAALYRSMGNSKVSMLTSTLMNAINIAGNALLIFGFHMGVAGAALATVIGQAISCLTALVFSLRHRADLGLLPRYLRPEAEMVKRTLKLGFPVALQWTIASISWLVVLTLINKYGVTVSAGNGVSNKIRDFCQLFLSALTTGAGTMCAQCLGAGLYDRAEQVMKTCMKLALAMAAVIIVVAEVFAPQFAMIFTPDPEVQHWAVVNLRIEIVCQLFYAGMFTYNTLATGSGHTVFIMWNSFLNCIVVRLILAVVLEHFLGIYGVYIACGVAVASSVPVGWWFYRSKRWMTMKNIH